MGLEEDSWWCHTVVQQWPREASREALHSFCKILAFQKPKVHFLGRPCSGTKPGMRTGNQRHQNKIMVPSSGFKWGSLNSQQLTFMEMVAHYHGQKDQYHGTETIIKLIDIILGQKHKHRASILPILHQ